MGLLVLSRPPCRSASITFPGFEGWPICLGNRQEFTISGLVIGEGGRRSHKGVRDPRPLGRRSECGRPAGSHG